MRGPQSVLTQELLELHPLQRLSEKSSPPLCRTGGAEWSRAGTAVFSWAGLRSVVLPLCIWAGSSETSRVTPSLHRTSRVYCSHGKFTKPCLQAEL